MAQTIRARLVALARAHDLARPGLLQLRQVPTLRFVWSECIIRESGTTPVCRMQFFSQNAATAFMVRTILALALPYLTVAFVSPFHTRPRSTSSSTRQEWRVQRLSSVDVIRPDIDDQLCRRDSLLPLWRILSVLVAL